MEENKTTHKQQKVCIQQSSKNMSVLKWIYYMDKTYYLKLN